MTKDGIPHDEWVLELQRLSAKSGQGMTAAEWAESMGVSIETARMRLRKARAAGWLISGQRSITTLDGKPSVAPVYQVVKPKEVKR